ncbi:MAG: hypothetical protein PHQ03_11860 [Methylococcales bacterium]|nr:hypothetical protein [Methylococcales bacterium]
MTLRIGESSTHCHSLTAIVKACDNAAMYRTTVAGLRCVFRIV